MIDELDLHRGITGFLNSENKAAQKEPDSTNDLDELLDVKPTAAGHSKPKDVDSGPFNRQHD